MCIIIISRVSRDCDVVTFSTRYWCKIGGRSLERQRCVRVMGLQESQLHVVLSLLRVLFHPDFLPCSPFTKPLLILVRDHATLGLKSPG